MNMTPSDALTTARDMLNNRHCIYSPREYREVIRAILPYATLTDRSLYKVAGEWRPAEFLD